MSFIGIVTRKEQDTGVTLEAKIVTPNKKKAARQKFKVRVKKTGLSDYECCVLDQATVRGKLTVQQDLTAVKEDINFTYNGENGTKIKYTIENTAEPRLTDYLGEDGKLIARPKYGQNDASGYIVMTVEKGKESISTKIRVTIKQILEQEVLACPNIRESSLWNAIRGENAQWANDLSSGHKNIFYNLKLISTSSQLLASDREAINALTDTPIQITWEVVDNAINSVITQDRISSSGVLFTPSYKDACTLIGTTLDAVLVGTTQYNKRVRIGGLTLKATFTVGGKTKTVFFDCSTCSKYITNKEVADYAQNKVDVILGDDLDGELKNKRLRYRELTDSEFETIVIPSTVTDKLYIGLPCSTTALQSCEIEELNLSQGQVDYTFTHKICTFKEITPYDDTDSVFSATAITNTSRDDNEHFGPSEARSTRWALSIDVKKLKGLSVSTKKNFTIETTVSATRYTKDGTSESAGGGETIKLYCHIKLDDSQIKGEE